MGVVSGLLIFVFFGDVCVGGESGEAMNFSGPSIIPELPLEIPFFGTEFSVVSGEGGGGEVVLFM